MYSMNEKNKDELINSEFSNLFDFNSEKSELDHEARMISFRFLSEIEKIDGKERGMKNRIAKKIGVSKSFITQLFNGDKLINLPTLAKIQKTLGVKFEIVAYPENELQSLSRHYETYHVMPVLSISQPDLREFQTVENVKSVMYSIIGGLESSQSKTG